VVLMVEAIKMVAMGQMGQAVVVEVVRQEIIKVVTVVQEL